MRSVHHRPTQSHPFPGRLLCLQPPQHKWVHLDHGTLPLVGRINLKNQLEERGPAWQSVTCRKKMRRATTFSHLTGKHNKKIETKKFTIWRRAEIRA